MLVAGINGTLWRECAIHLAQDESNKRIATEQPNVHLHSDWKKWPQVDAVSGYMAPEKILIEIKQEDHLKHFNRVDGVAV
jgi:hypothetical protein